jgi:hypothetical protein
MPPRAYDGQAWHGGNGVAYGGFVNGETAAVLTGTLGFGGSAQGAVGAGNYVLTALGLQSDNYAVAYRDGTLAVTAQSGGGNTGGGNPGGAIPGGGNSGGGIPDASDTVGGNKGGNPCGIDPATGVANETRGTLRKPIALLWRSPCQHSVATSR